MEVLELNEAFAAQSLGVIHELSQKCDLKKEEILARCNPNGGAIALGHPVGASGNRIIVTLLHEMIKAGNKLGLRKPVHRRRNGHRGHTQKRLIEKKQSRK